MVLSPYLHLMLVGLLATDLYRIAAIIGLPTAVVGGIVTVCLGGGLLLTMQKVVKIILKKDVLYFILMFSIWPIFSLLVFRGLVYPELLYRNLSYTLVFLTMTLLCTRISAKQVDNFLLVLMAIQCIGAFLSLLWPSIFISMAEEADATLLYERRAFGFMLQPNQMAIVSLFLFLIFRRETQRYLGLFSGFFLATLLTVIPIVASGSRYSIVLFAVAFVAKRVLSDVSRPFSREPIRKLVTTLPLILFIYFLTVILFDVLELNALREDGNLYDRLSALLSLNFSHSGDYEGIVSAQLRESAQERYFHLIVQEPIFGYGLGAEREFFSMGRLYMAAHSSLLALALQFGVPFALLFVLVLIRPLATWSDSDSRVRANYALFLVFALISITLNHGLLESTVFFVVYPIVLIRLWHASGAAPPIHNPGQTTQLQLGSTGR